MGDDAEPTRDSRQAANRYELIMVAAREARRLNDRYRFRGVEPKTRLATEAIDRALAGLSYRYGDPSDDVLDEEPEEPRETEAPAAEEPTL